MVGNEGPEPIGQTMPLPGVRVPACWKPCDQILNSTKTHRLNHCTLTQETRIHQLAVHLLVGKRVIHLGQHAEFMHGRLTWTGDAEPEEGRRVCERSSGEEQLRRRTPPAYRYLLPRLEVSYRNLHAHHRKIGDIII